MIFRKNKTIFKEFFGPFQITDPKTKNFQFLKYSEREINKCVKKQNPQPRGSINGET